ncbi:galactose mutarotase-like domain-containing protein [Dactylonectria macrodidyma]|uniref:Galactose mutarotase-like domain-containing protein n=1 Tax=Dactylonectria macrodidyma TaxID=307937 RepID=A0A9P9FH84_9HYPO|nr:galactose mutarotase-like domain-containing protein [Dactylonectria macrodidyma]
MQMKIKECLLGLALLALPWTGEAKTKSNGPDSDGKYWVSGDGIKAAFIPYGASISNLLINDQYGIERDVVAGFDNASFYSIDKAHPHFGGVPGRYANRIKNSSFVIDGEEYHVTPNDNPTKASPKGADTLHGGPDGWDYRNFTVVSHTKNSITFSIVDPDGKEGFPGEVVSYITYTLEGMDWHIKMLALATTKKTPIMLSSHTYWNLDGFANNETSSIFNHTFHMPYGGQRVGVDNILIPTGEILANTKGSVNDFWSKPKQIGAQANDPDLVNNCGFNCTGYDTCYTVNRGQLGAYDWRTEGPVATLSSEWSGIKLDVYSDQDAFQLYSCTQQDGSMPLKKTQGLFNNTDFPRIIPRYGCVVLEVQDFIDGINHPEWMRDRKQVFGPGDDPYVLQARYSFSILES